MHYRLLITLLTLCLYNITFAQEPKLMLPIGHTDLLNTVQFSPDGKKIVTSSADYTAKIWDVKTGILLLDLIHSSEVKFAQFNPDGKKIITISSDRSARIWDANAGTLLSELKYTRRVNYAQLSPDGKKIVIVTSDTIKIVDASTGNLVINLKENTDDISLAQFSPDGKKIATSAYDNIVKIWSTDTGNLLIVLKGHSSNISSAQFSSDGKKIVTVSSDKTTKTWDSVTGTLLMDLKLSSILLSAQFSPDGKKIVTTTLDNTVKIWDVTIGTLLTDLNGHSGSVSFAQFSPDGKKIVTASSDKTAKIWDAVTGTLLIDLKQGSVLLSAKFSPDGKKIATSSYDNIVKIWNAITGTLIADTRKHVNGVRTAGFSPDGKKIITLSSDNSAKIWNANTGTLLINLKKHTGDISGIQFNPDGEKIITFSDNEAKIWDAASGTLLADLKGYSGSVSSAQFSPDGKKIVITGRGTTKIWDAASGTFLTDLKGHLGFVLFARFSPDGKRIATIASSDNTAKIWDAATGALLADLKGHSGSLLSTQFSPDGKKIVTASSDSTAKIWDAVAGTLLADLKGHSGLVHSAQFSRPDGEKIFTNFIIKQHRILINVINTWDAATGTLLDSIKYSSTIQPQLVRLYTNNFQISPDGKKLITTTFNSIQIWDAASGTLLADLKGHSGSVSSTQFSPDGKKIISTSLDNTCKIWDSETGNNLYTFFDIDDNDYLIVDKDNHYDGTEAARKLLYFTCGTEVIELDQVKDQLWVPNLAERIMNGETINAQKLSDLNICNLTPVVDTIEQTALQYRFQITPRLGGLGVTIVYVNGIEVKRYTPQQLIKQKEGYQLLIDKKELQKFFVSGKENSIVVKSLTAKNSISSRSASISEKANETVSALPNLYAIVVGVSDYKGEELDLKFAAKDAVDIGNAIDASAKKLLNTDGKEHVFIYKINTGTNRDKFPEKNSIKQAFTEIAAKAQPNDILLVFFAGHGVMESEKNQFYFLTADASIVTVSGALKEVGISTDELTEWIKPQVMKAQKRILIFDACNSGQAIKEMISIGKKEQNFLAARGDEKSQQIKAVEKLNERSGMFILSASASDQKAYEMGKYNQGALTYSLLKAIKEEPGILEDRKYLNISRWFNAAEKTVGELSRETGTRQQPQIVSTTNFNIGVVDEEVRNKIVLPFEKPMFTRSDFRNTDLRVDNLKLRTLIDKELDEISGNASNAIIIYSPEYDGANVYAISGDYTIKGNDVNVSVILTKGGTEIKNKFEVKGNSDQPELIARSIINIIVEWMQNNKD